MTTSTIITTKKKKFVVAEGYTTTTSIGGGQNSSSSSSITKRIGTTDNCHHHSSTSTIIIPSYPANNYVDRRHFISLFCITLLAAIFSYGGLNIMLMNRSNHQTTTTTARSLFLGSSIMLGSSSSGGGIFSSSNSVIGRRQHDASSSSLVNIANNNKSRDDYFTQVRSFLNANEPRIALEELLEADLVHPDDVELKLYLGSTYTLLIEYDKAISAYQQALDLIERQQQHPDADNKVYTMRALTMMGVLHRGRGR
jgi:hypothetical protein